MKMDEDKACEKPRRNPQPITAFSASSCSGCATALCFFYEAVEASMMGWLTSVLHRLRRARRGRGADRHFPAVGFAADRPLLVQRDRCEVPSVADDHGHVLRHGGLPRAARHSEPRFRFSSLRRSVWVCACPACTAQRWLECRRPVLALSGIHGHLCYTERSAAQLLAPAAIGVAANHGGIRIGLCSAADRRRAMLVVSALCNMHYLKKR